MTETELNVLADKIVAGLQAHVIPAALPKMAGEWLRGQLDRQYTWVHMLPLTGPDAIQVRYILSPEGSIHIELATAYGEQFWQGTLVAL